MEYLRKAALTGVWTAFFFIVLWVAGVARIYWSQPDLANAILYPPGRALPDFSLVDSNHEIFDKSRLAGKWNFVFFGYTGCPDVCPHTLQTLQWAADRIRQNGELDNVRFVFISVDPARDSLSHLKDYVSYFSAESPGNTEFLGIAGDDAQLSILAAGMDATYRRAKSEFSQREGYFMDHSANIYLISPQAELYAMLPPPHTAEIIAADFQRILAHFSKTQVMAVEIAKL